MADILHTNTIQNLLDDTDIVTNRFVDYKKLYNYNYDASSLSDIELKHARFLKWNYMFKVLDKYHTLFSAFYRLGFPHFTDSLPTACVSFNNKGAFCSFLWNPQFFDSLNVYEAAFVLSHECMHVILEHGQRMHDFIKNTGESNYQAHIGNISMDTAINELLFRQFGFDRDRIKGSANPALRGVCVVESVFESLGPDVVWRIPVNKNWEWYYKLIIQKCKEGAGNFGTIDVHNFNEGEGENGPHPQGKIPKDLIDKLSEQMTAKDVNEVQNILAGKGHSNKWKSVTKKYIKPKRKFETIIKKWEESARKSIVKTWQREKKRYSELGTEFRIKGTYKLPGKKKTIYFFLDTSGSCYSYSQRFFDCARSLNREIFDIHLYCFDDYVQKINIDGVKLPGGGGTCFAIIEECLRKLPKYPDAVFVVTDGYGTPVSPLKPHNWHWLLTEGGDRQFCHSASKVYDLSAFE